MRISFVLQFPKQQLLPDSSLLLFPTSRFLTFLKVLKSDSIAAAICGPSTLLLLLSIQGLLLLVLTRGPPSGRLWGPGPDMGDYRQDHTTATAAADLAHYYGGVPVLHDIERALAPYCRPPTTTGMRGSNCPFNGIDD
jgi:hypothetical protein